MDAQRFDELTQSLTTAPSRRRLLHSFAGAALGLAPLSLRDETSAKKRKAKLKRNEFGCVDAGKPCGGKDSACCSGI